MKDGQIMLERLRDQMSEMHNAAGTYKVLKSDLYRLLRDYMPLSPEDMELSVNMDEKGNYVIRLTASAPVLAEAGNILE